MKTLLAQSLEQTVEIPAGKVRLEGDLVIPENSHSIVLFAHGSGSSRHSVRNRFVANVLVDGGLSTLLFDLLSSEEESIDLLTAEHRFDIPLLSARLVHAIEWITTKNETRGMHVGLFGSSTGAAAALVAASRRPELVHAVVSRGGRPDLAAAALASVRAPTLLIVGGKDTPVIALNREAQSQLRCENQLHIIPGATHLFEEPGTLETVAEMARDWFISKLSL